MNSRKFTLALVLCISSIACLAQTADSMKKDEEFKPSGKLWGNCYFDYVYKNVSDTVNLGRGGANQYSKIPAGASMMQFRRVYLGYNYDIFPNVSAEFLLSAEDDYYPGTQGNQTSVGDVLGNNKFAPFIKLANVRWKNVFKGADLVFGAVNTPSFALLSEPTWGYASLERTVTDIRRTPSADRGIAIQGRLGNDSNYGYNFMVGNGTGGVRAENDIFKCFYGDVWAKFFKKRLIVDLYQDYNRLIWNKIEDGQPDACHSDRRMTKVFVAWTEPKFTVGFEAYLNTLMGDLAVYDTTHTFYRTTVATGFSIYVRGRLYKDKIGFVARYDYYDPSHRLNEIYNDKRFINYDAQTTNYDPTTKEQFVLLGLDFTPYVKSKLGSFHVMPNFWMSTYNCALPSDKYFLNLKGSSVKGTDAALRLTIYYLFGKKESVRY